MQEGERKSLSGFTALFISVLFHPLFMPLYGLLLIFNAPTLFWYIPVKAKIILFIIFLVNNVILPLLLMIILRLRNVIPSLTMEERQERMLPLMGVALLYAITSYILSKLQIPVFFKAYGYSLTILSLVLLMINRWYKISLHSAGAGALIATVLTLSIRMAVPLPFYLAGTVMTAGLVLSTRLRLNAHDQKEVYAGFFTGLIIIPAMMFLFQ